MNIKHFLFIGLLIAGTSLPSLAATLNVGSGKTYANPSLAAAAATPGDTVLIHPGNYQGTFWISSLKGNPNAWIVIMGVNKNTVILAGGSEGLHLSNVEYVKIQDLTFTGHTANGMNIDDAGNVNDPSNHIVVSNCVFKYMGAQGNNDFLKLSGIDSFEVANCTFLKAATGGSGIDMVGCHYGFVHHCTFDSMGSNSLQMKGGTRYMKIENNTFTHGGQRSLNLGGSTGLAYFRPQNATYEAADIQVYANVFIRSQAPIAFVGCERVDVANNTIYLPEKWVMRILQETVDTSRFVPCRNNMFRNNVVYTSSLVTSHINIGPNTAPSTFLFSHNLWYNSSNPGNSTPSLPTAETSGITGQDPLFTSSSNFMLQTTSPAIGSGTLIAGLPNDMQGNSFKNPPSRGAYEFGSKVSIADDVSTNSVLIYPNPASSYLLIENLNESVNCIILNSLGQLVFSKRIALNQSISLEEIPAGLYYIRLADCKGGTLVKRLVKH